MSESQGLSPDPGHDSQHPQVYCHQSERLELEWLLRNRLDLVERLIGMIAHDLNNSLTVILSNLELAEMLAEPGQELGQFLSEAEKAAIKARSLTKRLDPLLNRAESVPRTRPLAEMIEESVGAVLMGSRVTCKFFISDSLEAGSVDSHRLGQVVQNLVLNAREAMPQGGMISFAAETVSSSAGEAAGLAAGSYIKFSVADEGRGIPNEILPRIFDPYFSYKEAGERRGLGLGLTVCRIILASQGGAISVESAPGSGTQVRFYLPASSAAFSGL